MVKAFQVRIAAEGDETKFLTVGAPTAADAKRKVDELILFTNNVNRMQLHTSVDNESELQDDFKPEWALLELVDEYTGRTRLSERRYYTRHEAVNAASIDPTVVGVLVRNIRTTTEHWPWKVIR